MKNQWHFKPIAKGETIREPTAGAFFANDAVSEPGFALVREGVQNSLDSSETGKDTFVRISMAIGDDAPAWGEVEPYVAKAWPHYEADTSGLNAKDLPEPTEKCPLLVFEDFNTHGLLGDPANPYPPKHDEPNNFFHFFRAEGRSDKDPTKTRGRWGLGKDTFFRCSRINSLFGLTVRSSDGRRLLMGKAVLKSHYVGDDYLQDGYFGLRADPEEHFVMPVEDDQEIQDFLKVFPCERGQDPGLSIIVPWPDPEISAENIIQSVCRNFFYTILSGDLSVMVQAQTVETLLDKGTLLSEIEKFPEVSGDFPLIELAAWAVSDVEDTGRHELNTPSPQRAWHWSAELFPDGLKEELRGKWQNGDRIALRVPVTVRRRGAQPQESYFDVYMVRDDSNQRARPIFIRKGIVISSVNAPYMRGVHALVVIDDEPLSAFLHQAENPSHILWQGQQLKKEYVSGVGDLSFVVRSVRSVFDFINAEDQEEDKKLLSDIFPIPGSVPGGKGTPPPPPPPLPPQPRRVVINRSSGGFTVAPGTSAVAPGSKVKIQTAYDTRRGGALTKYSTEDFRLDEHPIQYDANGIEVLSVNGNEMLVEVVEPDTFRISVTGFDTNRQIYIRADLVEV